MVSQKVLIPLSLLNQIIDLLGYWNIMDYDLSIHNDYYHILRELQTKKFKLQLRDAYAKIVQAPDQDARDQARIRYLQQKHRLNDLIEFPF
jgi:hypothetical protein